MLFDRLCRFVLVETVRPFDRFDRIDRFDCIRLSGNPPYHDILIAIPPFIKLEHRRNCPTACVTKLYILFINDNEYYADSLGYSIGSHENKANRRDINLNNLK